MTPREDGVSSEDVSTETKVRFDDPRAADGPGADGRRADVHGPDLRGEDANAGSTISNEAPPGTTGPRAGARSRLLAFAGLTVGGLLGIIASSQPWWRASGDGANVPFTGTDSTAGLSQALVIVALAGTLLVLALRVRGKQVIAVLLALTGVGMVTTGLLRLRPASSAVRTKLREISLADQFALEPTAWAWVYAAAGLLVAGGAVAMLLRARSWPQRADRFERTGAVAPEITPDTDSSVLWKAMDAGVDPTDAQATSAEHSGTDAPGSPDDPAGPSGASDADGEPGRSGDAEPAAPTDRPAGAQN